MQFYDGALNVTREVKNILMNNRQAWTSSHLILIFYCVGCAEAIKTVRASQWSTALCGRGLRVAFVVFIASVNVLLW